MRRAYNNYGLRPPLAAAEPAIRQPDRGLMNEALLEAFRHSAWATRALIAACRRLPNEELTRSAPGYGSILETLNHFILSDAGYAAILTGIRPEWANDGNGTHDFEQLLLRVDETEKLWEKLLSEPLDSERLLILDDGKYECPASVVVAQALHHSNAHREQVCAALTALGTEPPDVQPWAFADATGRAIWRNSKE